MCMPLKLKRANAFTKVLRMYVIFSNIIAVNYFEILILRDKDVRTSLN